MMLCKCFYCYYYYYIGHIAVLARYGLLQKTEYRSRLVGGSACLSDIHNCKPCRMAETTIMLFGVLT